MAETVDVVVIGMGPGGESVASQLASAGLSVVAAEARLVGGECPYFACIPTKMMVRAADSLAEARRVDQLAGSATVHPDYRPVGNRIRDEGTSNWDDSSAADRYTQTGGRLVRGRARLTGPRTVTVNDQEFTASRAIVLNPGTRPAIPPISGLDGTPYWTNRDIVGAQTAPESLIVLGGGPNGAEIAQTFARFGTRVDLVEMAERPLSREEPEAADIVTTAFEGDGIGVHTGAGADRVDYGDDRFTVSLGDRELSAERLLVATGRRTNLDGLGLDQLGIDADTQFVAPDDRMRIADGVYAIGDVTGAGQFTHVSVYQADIAARHILGEESAAAQYRAVPRVTFTDPEVGAVGLTESQAREQQLPVTTATTQLPSSTRGWIQKIGNDGMIKLVVDTNRHVLVGATSVGPTGGDVLGLLALAVHAEVPVGQLQQMMLAFPTYHRAINDALSQLG